MCGIVGIVDSSKKNKKEIIFSKLMRNIAHRGPDSEGRFEDQFVMLGMQRLKITDLQGGDQPFIDGNLVCFFNGEIYNYQTLKKNYITKKTKFFSKSDGEVIIHLYRKLGISFLNQLRGMFAISIYDKDKGELLLVRDRFGEKPIYIFEDEDGIIFASEIKAIMKSVEKKFTIDKMALYQYFSLNYTVEPKTMFNEIKKLNSGSYALIDVKKRTIKVEQYFDLNKYGKKHKADEDSLTQSFEETIFNQSISDVDIALALSSGHDSQLLYQHLKKTNQLKYTITLGYLDQAKSDETNDVRKSLELSKLNHLELKLSSIEAVEDFESTIEALGEPLYDPASSAYFKIFKEANKRKIKVLFFGHGGDEVFWGYEWMRDALHYETKATNSYFSNLKVLLSIFYKKVFSAFVQGELKNTIHLLIRFTQLVRIITLRNERMLIYQFSDNYWTNKKMLKKVLPQYGIDDFHGAEAVNRPYLDVHVMILSFLFKTYLKENGLTQLDRLSMHFGVEVRLPFLDSEVIMSSLDLAHRVTRDNLTKVDLYKRFFGYVNKSKDQTKKGFTPPVTEWQKKIVNKYKFNYDTSLFKKAEIFDNDLFTDFLKSKYFRKNCYEIEIKFMIVEILLKTYAQKIKF